MPWSAGSDLDAGHDAIAFRDFSGFPSSPARCRYPLRLRATAMALCSVRCASATVAPCRKSCSTIMLLQASLELQGNFASSHRTLQQTMKLPLYYRGLKLHAAGRGLCRRKDTANVISLPCLSTSYRVVASPDRHIGTKHAFLTQGCATHLPSTRDSDRQTESNAVIMRSPKDGGGSSF